MSTPNYGLEVAISPTSTGSDEQAREAFERAKTLLRDIALKSDGAVEVRIRPKEPAPQRGN